MNRSIIAASIASLFLLSLTASASAQMGGGKTTKSMTTTTTESSKTCKVMSVATSSFDCGSQTFDVTSSTTYSGTTFSELAAGMSVTVKYHMSGTSAVADSVTAK